MIDDRVLYEVTNEKTSGVAYLAVGTRLDVMEGWGDAPVLHFQLADPFQSPRIMRGSLVEETDDGFVWKHEPTGWRFRFRVVTLDEWNSRLKYGVVGSEKWPEFPTTAELHEWWRRLFGGYGVYRGRQAPDGTPLDPD